MSVKQWHIYSMVTDVVYFIFFNWITEKRNSDDDGNDPNTNNEKDDDFGNRNSVDPMAYIIKWTN